MDVLDLLSLFNESNAKWIHLIVIAIFIATSVVSILSHLKDLDMIVDWRRRNELWCVFREYPGIKDFLRDLYREFDLRAGFNNENLMKMYFWMPSVFSLLLGGFVYYRSNLSTEQIGVFLFGLWTLVIVSSPMIFFMTFSPTKLKNLANFINFTVGSIVPLYLSIIVGFEGNMSESAILLGVDIVGMLSLLLILYPRLQKQVIIQLWNSVEFLPKKKVYLLQRSPLIKVITPDGQFEGKIWDIFNSNYLILRNGPKEILIPWSRISYLEIFGEKKVM
ncbi:hypothetical protein [Thermococcus gorgonarius]|uniref:Uncharacterized protein n=1 Tax=Thermococcus gorgonarius TaxID=71997 RepID=A0A2Z2M396_THEGO|nr:hypothetical protein [Thermococcus gorgonarius]ASJ00007.1 hypothetical protein A3K92_00170 [Thermococcus gorgonarius]